MKIVIDVPAKFLAQLRKTAKELEIPMDYMLEEIRLSVLTPEWATSELWLQEYVYPDRATVIRQVRKDQEMCPGSDLRMHYMKDGKQVKEFFPSRIVKPFALRPIAA